MGNEEFFLSLVRLGIKNEGPGRLSYSDTLTQKDWIAIEALAAQHGLSAVVIDGIEVLSEGKRPPKEVLLQWIGETLQGYEYRYEQYKQAISELASFYNSHGFKMMVLKGYACSLDWPKPEHRPCGDIDIWQFGQQTEADAALTKEKGIKVNTSHHHHTVFDWCDFMVENHYDFINTYDNKENLEIESLLKQHGEDDSHYVEVYGERVYLPSPNLHALLLMRHSTAHFAATGITLRQLLDWAFFVKAHGKEVDWKWLEDILDWFGMRRIYDMFNAICVEDLGFEVNQFTRVQFEPMLKDRVLKEILYPKFSNEMPGNVFGRVIYKIRRWKSNKWKYELCYKESRWNAFWYGVRAHLLKPTSI